MRNAVFKACAVFATLSLSCLCGCVTHELAGAAVGDVVLDRAALLGAWELIDITAMTPDEMPRNGFAPEKFYFTPQGKLHFINGSLMLREDARFVPYSFEPGFLTITSMERGLQRLPIGLRSDGILSITFAPGQVWSFRKLQGNNPFDRILQPWSVAVFQEEKRISGLDVKYDERNYSSQDAATQIMGVWEMVAVAGLDNAMIPPEGMPNAKWVYTADNKHYALGASDTSNKGAELGEYVYNSEEGELVVLYPGTRPVSAKVSFNNWGQLLLRTDGTTFFFRLVTKDFKHVPRLPRRNVLLL